MFDSNVFSSVATARDGVAIHGKVGGQGPPVLLLHGYPQTHVMWHLVAPVLARSRRVVMPDLRGYGASSQPVDASDPQRFSKREMALDAAHLMAELGHDSYDVVGHDRGGRVGYRLALDLPERVGSLAVLDIVPTRHMFEHVDRAMAEAYFHWFFLTRPDSLPEVLIGASPETWLRSRFDGRHAGGRPIEPQAYDAYVAAFTPEVIAGSCADYRAAATIDLAHDREAPALDVPVLALWGAQSYVGRHFDVRAAWEQVATIVHASPVHADHYLAEENPEATIEALEGFWKKVR